MMGCFAESRHQILISISTEKDQGNFMITNIVPLAAHCRKSSRGSQWKYVGSWDQRKTIALTDWIAVKIILPFFPATFLLHLSCSWSGEDQIAAAAAQKEPQMSWSKYSHPGIPGFWETSVLDENGVALSHLSAGHVRAYRRNTCGMLLLNNV